VCRQRGGGSLKFSLEWTNTSHLTADWEIAGDVEGRWQQIRELRVSSGNKCEIVKSSILGDACDKSFGSAGEHLDPASRSLLTENLNRLAKQVQWVSGVRVAPRRVITYGGGVASKLKFDGRNALSHLIASKLSTAGEPLNKAINSFFESLGDRLALDNPVEGVWRALLHPMKAPSIGVNLCDTGEGYSQVLPILVALARAQADGPELLCVEQPELHLHTRAQAELAQTLIKAAGTDRPRILVETHSEVLLTSIQLAIAKGEILPEKVVVYWVESRDDGTSDAIQVNFLADGRPTDPSLLPAFEEVLRLGHELTKIQLK
jgi:hypothetical protein